MKTTTPLMEKSTNGSSTDSPQSNDDGVVMAPQSVSVPLATRQLMYLYLPNWQWLQWIITCITGCPYEGQKPLFTKSHWFYFLLDAAMVLGGYTLSAAGLELGGAGLLLLPIGWIITVGGARAFQTSVMHFCIHTKFTGNKKNDRLLAEAISVILCINNAQAYFDSHCGIHHNPSKIGTVEDDDLIFLLWVGFQFGMSKEELWKHLAQTMVSPRFHYLFLKARFMSNFVSVSLNRRRAATLWWIVVLVTIWATNTWLTFLVAGVFPLTLLYHCAALLQFLSEHLWGISTDEFGGVSHLDMTGRKLRSISMSPIRFFGERPPQPGSSWINWGKWWLRLFFVHLPLRVAVVPSPDLVWHPPHHDHDYAKADYAKAGNYWRNVDFNGLEWVRNKIEAGKSEEILEAWGLFNTIDLVFEVMSQKKNLKVNASDIDVTEVLLGM